MGVSYFSCDECGCVMNDAGGCTYHRIEYEKSKNDRVDGVLCKGCYREITADRISKCKNCKAIFVLKTADGIMFYPLKKITKTSLKELRRTMEQHDLAVVIESDEEPEVVWSKVAKDEFPFEPCQKTYEFFIHSWEPANPSEHQNFPDEHYYWFLPPQWVNVEKLQSRATKLRETIIEYQQTLEKLETKIQFKRQKLLK